FRYKLQGSKAIIAHNNHVFTLTNTGEHDHENKQWVNHFLREDQPTLHHPHPYVQEAIKNTQGLRVLRQDPWDCLVAFIISQNNHQKRIQQNVLDISTYGQPLTKGFHAFPKPHELPGEEELRQLGLGYRAKHVAALKKIDLDWLHNLKTLSYKEAKQELQTLSGVGPKVADCVLLFSLDFEQACPEDTWIKKIFAEHDLTREDLGEQAGLIQQSLFHYTRSKKL
ncbi:MAG: DNA glycosylase, partial [Candidatus Woesearchaeota archaeon]